MTATNRKSCCAVSREQHFLKKEIDVVSISTKTAHASNMVWIPAGEFLLGSEDEASSIEDGEFPRRKVQVPSYYIDRYAVTNERFSQFINETGYVTDAEKYGWSFVFHLFVNKENEKDILGSPEQTPWWIAVQGASWKHPEDGVPPLPIGLIIQLFMCHGMIHKLIVNGLGNVFRQKQNGNMPLQVE